MYIVLFDKNHSLSINSIILAITIEANSQDNTLTIKTNNHCTTSLFTPTSLIFFGRTLINMVVKYVMNVYE